ncbi:MAG: nuclear transport factor 2 family protein [Pseudomonadota bacterium]
MRNLNAALACAALLLAGCAQQQGSDAHVVAELAKLQSQVTQLQNQAQAATDWTQVANLQATYGYYVDKMHWDDAADLFAKDATLEIAGRGLFKGQDRIRTYLHALGEFKYGTLYNHMQLQPVIHIAADGKSAQARWRAFIQVAHLGKDARWGEATYENQYIKQDGVWRINKLHGFITYYVDFDKGWNKGGVVLPARLGALEPDAPPTVKYGAFPEVFVPPYHYKNPVSGK